MHILTNLRIQGARLGRLHIFFIWCAGSAAGLAQPFITAQPTNQSVSIGASATFSVEVDPASLPVTYQWQKAGAALAGAASQVLTLTNIQVSNAGAYSVVVKNASGSVTSDPGTLSVDPAFTKITAGPVVAEGGISAGCAWGDFNNDGWVDLFVVRGSVLEKARNHLFKNNGDGTFTKITTGSIATEISNSLGATWADFDNDGNLDLFVARALGQTNALYRNLGDGTFASVTDTPFSSRGGKTQSGTWADLDGDGNLDLFLTARDSSQNSLYQNVGNGKFIKITRGLLSTLPSGNFRPGIWADFDNDGDPDLFLNYFLNTQNLFFRNEGEGAFSQVLDATVTRGDVGNRGAAWGDFDNDGNLDLFVGNALGRGNQLFRNNGNGTFRRMPPDLLEGSAANSAYPAWGDYDNDGFLDLFVPNGEQTGENNALYHNSGDGNFTRVQTGSLANDGGHSVSCGWADFDNDGFLDLFVGNLQGEKNFLYRNNGNTNHWLKFKLIGVASNRSAIGAKVRVSANYRGALRTQMREVGAGSGHNGGELIAHFGLGEARVAETVRIEWPSGQTDELKAVSADQFLTVTETGGNLALRIRTNPRNQVAGLGEPATLYVTYTGAPPISLQWLRDGQPLKGETNKTLTFASVQRDLLGDYSVVLSGGGISLTSRVARLVLDPFTRVTGAISELGGSRGGSWADYDNDGDLDLLVWNGGSAGKTNYVFRNDGPSGFIRLTQGPVATDPSDHHSAVWADFDNDGDLDLFTANSDGDANDLFRNNGDGTFTRAGSGTEADDFAGFGGAAWADFDNDGWVDLFIANAVGRPHSLYRNLGNGAFSRITKGPIVEVGGDSRGAAWSDYDNDGKIDLIVTTGDGKHFLFHNLGNGNFEADTRSDISTGGAVSAAWGDYDNDGLQDLLLASDVETNALFHNDGNGVFKEVLVVALATNPIASLGAAWGDYDNDGLLDIFVAGSGRNALYRNLGNGTFSLIVETQAMPVEGASFQCSWADFDNDGFLDLFLANGGHVLDVPNTLYHNNGNTNHWAKFRLVGTKSNRAGIGAKIRVTAKIRGSDVTQLREITGGDGAGNSQPLEAHFGLAEAERIDTVRIEWPSGKTQELKSLAANQIFTITEPGDAPSLTVVKEGADLKFSLTGGPSASYRIEVSTDLKTWSALTTVTIPSANGAANFADKIAAGQPARFYRAVRI